MRGDTKLDRNIKKGWLKRTKVLQRRLQKNSIRYSAPRTREFPYTRGILIVVCLYALLFVLCQLDVKDYMEQPDDREELLCMITGFPPAEMPLDSRMTMVKWMLAISVLFILAGKEVYDRQNNLKYIAMIRYGSYRGFYRSLMNRTVFHVLLYGGMGTLLTYILYTFGGNAQVGGVEFLGMGIVYLSQLLLLCLLQTVCMILTGGYAASVILLIIWFVTAICGHLVMKSGWVWLPVNWGMYIRGARVFSSGVPDTAYCIQAGACLLLWAGAPLGADCLYRLRRQNGKGGRA